MTNYIINPSWFYWIDVVDGLCFAASFVVVLLGIMVAVISIIYGINCRMIKEYPNLSDDEKRINSQLKRIMPILWIVWVASVLASIFIPSKDTLITMMVAKYATYENAGLTVDALKSAVDYIVQAIQSLS